MDATELERELAPLHPACFGWALRCCGGRRQEAEEVLQIVYLKILEGRARFEGRSTLKTWLFAVIRRTAAGRRRRHALRRALLERWARREPAAEAGAGPEERLRAGRRGERVRRALATLSERQRQVVELVFFHDLSLREASEVLGVTVGAVRTHYDRGKRALRRQLSAAAPGGGA